MNAKEHGTSALMARTTRTRSYMLHMVISHHLRIRVMMIVAVGELTWRRRRRREASRMLRFLTFASRLQMYRREPFKGRSSNAWKPEVRGRSEPELLLASAILSGALHLTRPLRCFVFHNYSVLNAHTRTGTCMTLLQHNMQLRYPIGL